MTPGTTAAQEPARRDTIRAFRTGRYLLIAAAGELPSPGHEVDIAHSPADVFPPMCDLLQRQRPGEWPAVVVPYRYGEVVPCPEDQPTVVVNHADGQDEVAIEPCGPEMAEFAAVMGDRPEGAAGALDAVGMSPRLSFDEAFADALATLPPATAPHPDALSRVQVVDIAGLFGGIAGFHHLAVRVRRVPG